MQEQLATIESHKRHTVLIVDDIHATFSLLEAVMRDDYTLLYAANGQDALEIAQSEIPDLILLDIEMPVVDGYEICKQLKELPAVEQIPIIFLTGHTGVAEEEQGLKLGAVDYIHKPFYPPLVRLRVKNHLMLKQQRDELERLAHIDSLTGLTNRHAYNISLVDELVSAIEQQHSIGLLMVDVDHFKQFNDQHGHLVGDRCLTQIARIMQDCVDGERDIVARYGGEEFSIILPNSDLQRTETVGQRIVETVERMQTPATELTLRSKVTVSAGGAALVPRQGCSPELLVDLADRALYRAKKGGRNRFVAASQEDVTSCR